MFKWLSKIFNRKKLKPISKDEMICIKMKDGSVVPLVNSDKLELIKYPDGSAQIWLKKGVKNVG